MLLADWSVKVTRRHYCPPNASQWRVGIHFVLVWLLEANYFMDLPSNLSSCCRDRSLTGTGS